MSVTRITNLMVSNTIVSEINSSEDTLAQTEEELSSGLSINEPSDNPSGAALAIQLNGQLTDLTNYSDNITDGTGWTTAANTGLTTIQDDLQRVQELVTEAGNGSNSAQDLDDISDEVSQLQQSIDATLNSQYNGQAVFTGTGNGNAPTTRTISPGTTVTVSADLSGLLAPSDGSSSLTDTLNQIQSDLTGTSLGGMTPDANNLNTTDLSNLATNLDQLDQVQTTVGATTDQLEMASSSIQTLQTNVTSELSDDDEVNPATAETNYNDEEAAFEAALKAGSDIVQDSLMDFLDTSS